MVKIGSKTNTETTQSTTSGRKHVAGLKTRKLHWLQLRVFFTNRGLDLKPSDFFASHRFIDEDAKRVEGLCHYVDQPFDEGNGYPYQAHTNCGKFKKFLRT